MHWNSYKQAKLAEGVLEYTLDKYFLSLRKFNDYLFIHDIKPTKEAVQQFLNSLHKQGLSPFRIRNVWVALKSFYTYLEIEGLYTDNPMHGVKAPKLPKRTIEIYSNDDINSIVYASRDTLFEIIFTVFVKTGIRGNELLQIRHSDINFLTQTIHIHGKGAKDRSVPFDNQCHDLLMSVYSGGIDFVFPTNLIYIRKILKSFCNFTSVDYRGLHCFRHTFACNYLKDGGNPLDLMYILGHSTLQMVNHYSQWLAEERAAYNYHKIYNNCHSPNAFYSASLTNALDGV